ncbi:Alpha/Beta hydrolase protein [Microdochium trichocladiopsis]|uniref:Alpha/Beta hydrolase protein n=1 Tax=Microdochium trichocladiopsis TaxID=1682393 RepID=A0A9P9BL67_9PEZI|nr:Alpha/Beta hydrolase protein [Microdochium trichocladiopsis]KAH7024612.1 Alpha/Beta hydrolase protein [Microdochium trichocladiopsis]
MTASTDAEAPSVWVPPPPTGIPENQLDFYPAPEPNGTGVLVLPGGGYSFVSTEHEGFKTTAWLNARGYDAWMLNYATTTTSPAPLYPKPQQQALAAIDTIRRQGRVSKLGIWGYSAGGHLAATTITDPKGAASLAFAILAYPVISMDPSITHAGSRENLIGTDAPAELTAQLSAEANVSPQTPRMFLFHTANDSVVPVDNAMLMAAALARNKVPFHLLVLPDGNHGLSIPEEKDDPARTWTTELDRWLKYSV